MKYALKFINNIPILYGLKLCRYFFTSCNELTSVSIKQKNNIDITLLYQLQSLAREVECILSIPQISLWLSEAVSLLVHAKIYL